MFDEHPAKKSRAQLLKELSYLEDWALVTEYHVAAALLVSVSKVRSDRCTGNGVPFRRVGKRRALYRKGDLMHYLETLERRDTTRNERKMLEAA